MKHSSFDHAGWHFTVHEITVAGRRVKWKTTFQLTFLIAALVWLGLSEVSDLHTALAMLRGFTSPDSWFLPTTLWIAVALTVISGANYLWHGRRLIHSMDK